MTTDSQSTSSSGKIAWRPLLAWSALPAVVIAGAAIMVLRGGAGEVTKIAGGGEIHSIEGVDVGPDGMIYAASLYGQKILRIDPASGATTVVVDAPDGAADDVAVGPKGSAAEGVIAWTNPGRGQVGLLRPGGTPTVVLQDVPRINPIAFSADGRLFAAQTNGGDNALWEIDVSGAKPPRVVTKGQGALNGFEFGRDGRLYAPLFGTDQLVAVDPDSGAYTIVAKGVGSPAAVDTDSQGNIVSIDYKNGNVWRTTPDGASTVITQLREPIDSIAIGADDTLYISEAADSSITAIDRNGAKRDVVRGSFVAPLGMAATTRAGEPSLLIADPFGYRYVDTATGKITRPPWAEHRNASIAVAANDRFIAMVGSNGRVKKIDRQSDQVLWQSEPIRGARGVALTDAGDVLIADMTENRILKIGDDGAPTPIATDLKEPVAVTVNGAEVLVVEAGAGAISQINMATGTRSSVVSGLSRPAAAVRLPSGRFAVLEPETGTVALVGPEGGERRVLASDLPLSTAALNVPAGTPAGLARGSDGALYVTCPGDNTVRRISGGSAR
jgi:sugar lactone lactonase YvrE